LASDLVCAEQRVLATDIHSYGELLDVLRDRMRELDVTFETIDHVSGLQARYTQKLLGGVPSKRFGDLSLGCILQSLGVKLVAIEDAEALARVRDRLVPREMKPRSMPPVAPQLAAGESSAAAGAYQPS
jgi:hypothetical protein